MRFRDFLNEMTGGTPVGNGYSYSWRVPFKRKDGVIVDADFSSHKTLTLLEIWLTKYGHFTDEELKNLRVESDNKFFGGMKWDEAYEKYRKIRLKRNNLEQYYINYTKPTSSGNKIVPKDLKELRSIMRDVNVYLGDIEIPKNITSLENAFSLTTRSDFSGLENWDVSHITNMNYLFQNCKSFTGKEIKNWNVSSVASMREMFRNCKKFNANLSKWNISNVKDTNEMFAGCSNFTGKGLENWNTKNIEEMTGMFAGCTKFDADLSRWKTHNLKKMMYVFQDCYSFFGKGLENWDLSNVKAMKNDFTHTKVQAFKDFSENFLKKFEELGLDSTGEK